MPALETKGRTLNRTERVTVIGLGVAVLIGLAGCSDKPAIPAVEPVEPARTFNSDLALDVYVVRTPDGGVKLIGATPSPRPIEIPDCQYWYVRPRDGVAIDELSHEILSTDIPGLELAKPTDDDLGRLAGLMSLQALFLSGGEITDVGLVYVGSLTGLRTLYLDSEEITDAGLAHLAELTGLQTLNLYAQQVTDAGLAHLAGLTALQTLGLEDTQITDAGLVHLAGMTDLQSLYLYGARITDSGLADLAGLTGLQALSLSGAQITDAGLVHLTSLTGLQTLFLSYTPITDAGLAHLASLTGLRWLYLGDTQITDAGLVHLTGLTGLEALDLDETDITDAGLTHLAGLTSLQTLYLGQTQITDAGLPHLAGLTGLQMLDLTETQITDAGLSHLLGLTSLRELRLVGTQITEEGVAELRAALPEARVLPSPEAEPDRGAEVMETDWPVSAAPPDNSPRDLLWRCHNAQRSGNRREFLACYRGNDPAHVRAMAEGFKYIEAHVELMRVLEEHYGHGAWQRFMDLGMVWYPQDLGGPDWPTSGTMRWDGVSDEALWYWADLPEEDQLPRGLRLVDEHWCFVMPESGMPIDAILETIDEFVAKTEAATQAARQGPDAFTLEQVRQVWIDHEP